MSRGRTCVSIRFIDREKARTGENVGTGFAVACNQCLHCDEEAGETQPGPASTCQP